MAAAMAAQSAKKYRPVEKPDAPLDLRQTVHSVNLSVVNPPRQVVHASQHDCQQTGYGTQQKRRCGGMINYL
jgi:hypothetical protein